MSLYELEKWGPEELPVFTKPPTTEVYASEHWNTGVPRLPIPCHSHVQEMPAQHSSPEGPPHLCLPLLLMKEYR